MNRLLDLIGMSAGGWLGWALGSPGGIFVAIMLSIVGTGAGLYGTRRLRKRYLP